MKPTMLISLWSIALLFTLSASLFIESHISVRFHVVFIAFQALTIYVVLLNLLDSLLNLRELIENQGSLQKMKTKLALGLPIVIAFAIILSQVSVTFMWPSSVGLLFIGFNRGRLWYISNKVREN